MPVVKPKKADAGKKPKPARITKATIGEIARKFTELAKTRREERQKAKTDLRPKYFKNIEKLSPKQLSDLGNRGKDGEGFTAEDLKAFDEARKRAVQQYDAGTAGAPLYKLLEASTAIDKERASKLRNAVLYRIKFNELYFSVTAGEEWGCKAGGFHQVRIRLEQWAQNLTTTKQYLASTKKAIEGRISFYCNCERHQFWYNYLATIGGYALAPTETAFPKKKNPSLTGACCKHTIKAFLALRSPMIQNMLAKEMEKQAGEAVRKARDLTEEELQQASRARKKDLTDEEIQVAAQKVANKKASDEAKNARSEMRTKEQGKVDKLMAEKETERVEKETYRAIAKKEHALSQDLRKTVVALMKNVATLTKTTPGLSFEAMMASTAESMGGGLTKDDLMSIAKEEKLI